METWIFCVFSLYPLLELKGLMSIFQPFILLGRTFDHENRSRDRVSREAHS